MVSCIIRFIHYNSITFKESTKFNTQICLNLTWFDVIYEHENSKKY